MRLKIRVKVKHLVTGIVAASMFVGAGYKAMPVVFDLMGVHMPAAGPEAKKWKYVQDHVLADGADSLAHGFQIYVGPEMSFGIGDVNATPGLSWEEKLPLLTDYVDEGPAGGIYLGQAAKQLALYYSMTGETDKAIRALETAERRIGAAQTGERSELRFERAKLLVKEGEYGQATALMDEIMRSDRDAHVFDTNRIVQIAELKARVLIKQSDLSDALDSVNQGIASYNETFKELNGQPAPNEKNAGFDQLEQLEAQRRAIEQWSAGLKGAAPSVVSGAVTRSDGRPMAHVGVFLRTEDAVNHSILETEPYQTITDDQGRYSFADVLPGAYQLALGFNYDQIDGWAWPVNNYEWIDVGQGKTVSYPVVLKPLMSVIAPVNNAKLTGDSIDFNWQPVEGAAYYKLTGTVEIKEKNGASSIGVVIHDRIPSHEIRVPLDALYNLTAGISYDTVDGRLVPNPLTVLDFANPGQRFSWSVEAYDGDGRKLTQSNGYRLTKNTMGALPFFTLNARTLTEGDRLLLAGRIDDALAAYERAWEADSSDAYSLGKLIKLRETRDIKQSSDAEKRGLLPYKLRLFDLLPSMDGGYWLMDYYGGLKDWEKTAQYYKQALALAGYDGTSYLKSGYASALLAQGKFGEAKALLAETVPQDNLHERIGAYLASDLYVSGSIPHALTLAERYPERRIAQTAATDWAKLLQAMNAEGGGGEAYMKELKQALLLQYAGRQAELDRWEEASSHAAMVDFIKALARSGQ